MRRWKTDEVLDLLRAGLPHLVFNKDLALGDYTTSQILAVVPDVDNDSISICGFNAEKPATDFDDMDCTALEVRNMRSDSRGGCGGSDERVHSAYDAIRKVLRTNGFDHIVPTMNDYF
jgi:hypothetical protein